VVWQADFGLPVRRTKASPRRRRTHIRAMCNLDSLTPNQAAIIAFEWFATPAPDAPGEFDLSHASRL